MNIIGIERDILEHNLAEKKTKQSEERSSNTPDLILDLSILKSENLKLDKERINIEFLIDFF